MTPTSRPLTLAFVASASIHSARWVRFYADRGHRVHWFVSSPIDSPLPGVATECLPSARGGSKVWTMVQSALTLRRALNSLQPDVVHAHYAGVPGVMTALTFHRPFVLTAWGSDVLMMGRRAVLGLPVRWALRRADLVTCDANHMIEAMTRLRVPRAKIRRINFGTEVDRFRPVPRDPAIDERLGLKADQPRVISIRNFHPVYDIGTLIRAVPRVLERIPNAAFIIGGSGPEESSLKELAGQLGVSDSIRFCGPIPNEQLPLYYAAADVYVSTSLSDAGLAASTAEAMACGLPAVITDTGENDAWIDDGVTGYLVPARADAELASRIAALLGDEPLRRSIAPRGRSVIVERSNYHVEFEKMEQLYLALAPRSPAAATLASA